MAPVTEVDQGPKPVPITTTKEKVHDSETSSSTQADVTGTVAPDAAAAEKPSRHTHWTADNQTRELEPTASPRSDGKVILHEEEVYNQLGYGFSTWKKWTILTVIFFVQVSMNFNTSLYSNALSGIAEEFNVSEQAARCGAVIFLILYAFGCELWAPWSEEIGRKPILQASLFLVNIWQLPVALGKNFATILVGRALGGLSSAGGSVTLGMIADMWEADNQQYAVAYVVFSSVAGSVLGPVVGGFCQQYLHWRWCIWIQLIFGGFVQILHLVLVPETRSTLMIDKIAQKMRKSGENPNIYGLNELTPWNERFSAQEIIKTWTRPFHMFTTEPIVLTLSLLSGFSDALIFMFIQSFGPIYKQWGFDDVQLGLAFISILVGYLLAWFSFFPAIKRNIRERAEKPDDEVAQYESRLWWLLYLAPCLPIGLIGFAWTTMGPPLPWVASMVFVALVGIANYAIYMATIDYMICAYGPYSASATGGNGWSRDFLAGVLTLPATPFFNNIGGRYHIQYATTILFCISVLLVLAVYVIYWKGPILRKRSPFAQQLSDARATTDSTGHRLARLPTGSRANSFARSQQELRLRQALGSRPNSYYGSRANSRANSRVNSRRNSVAEV